jgi:lipoprotein-anchoring transpeptidase ErfK/SrfK
MLHVFASVAEVPKNPPRHPPHTVRCGEVGERSNTQTVLQLTGVDPGRLAVDNARNVYVTDSDSGSNVSHVVELLAE